MPRFQPEAKAAEELGLPLATFRHLVAVGRLPKPLPDVGLYDMKALDVAADRLSGIANAENALDSWMEKRHARSP